MTKTTLLAAASAAVVLFAGAANAGTLSGTLNSQAFSGGSTPAVYTVASEVKATAANVVSGNQTFDIRHALPTTGFAIGAAAPDTVYRVTLKISGGEFASGSGYSDIARVMATVGTGAEANLATAVINNGARTATQVQFIVTVKAHATEVTTLNAFEVETALKATHGQSASITSEVELLAGGVPTLVDTGSSVTALSYKPLFGALSASSRNALSALPNFRAFSAGAAPAAAISDAIAGTSTGRSAELANAFGLVVNAGTFYAGVNAATAVTPATIITGGSVTVKGTAGAQLDKLTATITNGAVGTITAGAKSDTSATFALNEAAAEALAPVPTGNPPAQVLPGTFKLTQPSAAASQVDIKAANYNIDFVPTYDTNLYQLPALAAVAAGAVTLDGSNYIAPWVGGAGAQSVSQIRLSNTAATASGRVTVRLLSATAADGSAFTPTTTEPYVAGTIGAGNDLVISSANLYGHFGNFRRGDFQITVESDASNLTAKLRNTRVDGTSTFEQSLGRQ